MGCQQILLVPLTEARKQGVESRASVYVSFDTLLGLP